MKIETQDPFRVKTQKQLRAKSVAQTFDRAVDDPRLDHGAVRLLLMLKKSLHHKDRPNYKVYGSTRDVKWNQCWLSRDNLRSRLGCRPNRLTLKPIKKEDKRPESWLWQLVNSGYVSVEELENGAFFFTLIFKLEGEISESYESSPEAEEEIRSAEMRGLRIDNDNHRRAMAAGLERHMEECAERGGAGTGRKPNGARKTPENQHGEAAVNWDEVEAHAH